MPISLQSVTSTGFDQFSRPVRASSATARRRSAFFARFARELLEFRLILSEQLGALLGRDRAVDEENLPVANGDGDVRDAFALMGPRELAGGDVVGKELVGGCGAGHTAAALHSGSVGAFRGGAIEHSLLVGDVTPHAILGGHCHRAHDPSRRRVELMALLFDEHE
jgi:hypothetical protein